MAKRSDAQGSDTQSTFEEALAELEAITAKMESGDVPLDESLKLYERGTVLVQQCQDQLNAAEEKIEQLSKTSAGKLASRPTRDDS